MFIYINDIQISSHPVYKNDLINDKGIIKLCKRMQTVLKAAYYAKSFNSIQMLSNSCYLCPICIFCTL